MISDGRLAVNSVSSEWGHHSIRLGGIALSPREPSEKRTAGANVVKSLSYGPFVRQGFDLHLDP